MIRRLLLLPVVLLALTATPGRAQFAILGENKVQYRKFNWEVLKGPHIDLYFYPEEAELAPTALQYAEESYEVLRLKFSHEVTSRIPLIVYASHSDFEQTNILPFTPPEGLLGVTDFLKRRVTLPFRGNLAEFRHTMRHELVHAFQISLGIDRYNRSPRSSGVALPLWWTEGLAEYWSAGEDARDEMILRDLVFSGRLPDIDQLTYVTGGIVYPLGGRIHRWLGETYGDWRAAQLYHDLWRYLTFEDAIEAIYGRTLAQLSAEFQLAMRRAYYPVSEEYVPLTVVARRVADQAVKPAEMPNKDGTNALYASPKSGFVTLMHTPLDGHGGSHSLVVSGRSADFASLHAFDSRVDASHEGLLLFSSQFEDRDALVIFNVPKSEIVGRYQFPQITSILSPIWARDSQSVIFSGLSLSGTSDLYRMKLPGGELEHLTDDTYQDLDPSLSPDGREVVFASDRTAGGLDGAVNLFILDLETRQIRQITGGPWVDETPTWSTDDRIYFTSDRDGVLNTFSVDTLGEGRRETSVWTGTFDAVPLTDRPGFLVSGFHDLSLGIYLIPPDSSAQSQTFSLSPEQGPMAEWTWPLGDIGLSARTSPQPYQKHLTLDFAAGSATFIPRYGAAQGITFYASDLLSNHLAYLTIASYQGRDFGDIFSNINAFGLYINQTKRLNWGVGAFRLKGNTYAGDFTAVYHENAIGGIGLLRYPLSRFTRLQATVSLEHSDRVDFVIPVSTPRRVGWIASHYLTYVRDNTLWMSTGPVDGGYLGITGGLSKDFSNARFDSFLLGVDIRRYFRLARRSAYAVRVMGFYSGGDRPDRINIGGTLGLRGYPIYGYIVGSRAYMVNQEIRFPLFNYLAFGTAGLGELRFPDIHGAFFVDVGKAWYQADDNRALLGSWGVSFRWPVVPGAVLRLDWGRRFTDGGFRGYGLTLEQRKRSFVQFFFGYNY